MIQESVVLKEERRLYMRCPVCQGATRLPITLDPSRPVMCHCCRRTYRVRGIRAWEEQE